MLSLENRQNKSFIKLPCHYVIKKIYPVSKYIFLSVFISSAECIRSFVSRVVDVVATVYP